MKLNEVKRTATAFRRWSWFEECLTKDEQNIIALSQKEEYNKFCMGEDYSFPACDVCKEVKFIDSVGMAMLNKWIREEHLACVCDTCLVPIEVIHKYKQELMRSGIPFKVASKAGNVGVTKMLTLMQGSKGAGYFKRRKYIAICKKIVDAAIEGNVKEQRKDTE